MTDVSKLQALAKKISSASPNVRASSIATADATVAQEGDIRRLLASDAGQTAAINKLRKDVDLILKGGGGGTRPGDPPPDPDPPVPPDPPPPDPPPGGDGDLGIIPNSIDGAYGTFLASLHPTSIRQDALSNALVTWGATHGASVLGLGGPLNMGIVNQYPTITLWEYDNEPYYRGVDINAWAVAARNFGQTFKAAYPTKTLILPMLVPSNGGDYFGPSGWRPWVDYVFDAAPNIGTYYDGWAAHPYSAPRGGPPDDAPLKKIRNQLVARNFTKDCWITEWGWSEGTGTDQINASTHATYLSQSVGLWRALPWVTKMYYFCSISWGTGFEPGFGLYSNLSGTERPAAQTFRNLV